MRLSSHTPEQFAVNCARKKYFYVNRPTKEKVAYLFFEIFTEPLTIVHLHSQRSSFNNHSAVFAILFIVNFSDFTTQEHGGRALAGVCRQLSARPPRSKECPFWLPPYSVVKYLGSRLCEHFGPVVMEMASANVKIRHVFGFTFCPRALPPVI